MIFANIHYLFLLILLIPYIMWYILKQRKNEASLQVSDTRVYAHAPKSYKIYLLHAPFILRVIAFVMLVLILARPQTTNSWKNTETEGIDIMLDIDISSTMLAEDLKPNRLEAAKEVATEFINGRPNDNIGLTLFAAESFTQCPLTTDQAVLVNLLREVKSGMIQDGTAIGLGLANAVNRLKDSPGKSKVVILLTDGINNQGAIAPVTAAELAKAFGIRVYTIGVGTYGEAPYPVPTPFGVQLQNMPVEIDEGVLQQIANVTGGKYFRATDNDKLQQIYSEIDQLEKSKIEVKHFSKKNEQYFIFGLLGMCLLIAQAVLKYTLLRKIP